MHLALVVDQEHGVICFASQGEEGGNALEDLRIIVLIRDLPELRQRIENHEADVLLPDELPQRRKGPGVRIDRAEMDMNRILGPSAELQEAYLDVARVLFDGENQDRSL